MLAELIENALAAGEESVKRGPELLPVLREAGVVDAGGYGLTVLLAGIVGALRGSEPPSLEHHAAARITHPQHASSTYRYCTNFAVTGTSLEQRRFVPLLEQIGDSVLVVGDPTTLKVHVHTDDPNSATALFSEFGVVSHLDVADMHAQVQQREERLSAPRAMAVCGALAVVTGNGMRSLFEGLGVHTLEGGPTLNPSTYDLLAAIHAIPAEQVVVLPNSANVVMAAERAAELSDKTVRVVPVALAAGGPGGRGQPRPQPRRRHQRRGDGADARARPHRRGRAGRPRRRPGTLPRGRRGRLHRGEDRGLGPPREALREVLEQLARERRADHLPARRRGSARRRSGPGSRRR